MPAADGPPAETAGPIDPKAFRHQEIVFSLMMGVIAILSRDNPLITYPEILWTFEGLLGFNLAYHFLLKRQNGRWWIPLVSMAANVLLVTVILEFSGGYESYFWPMYLLPIF